MVDQILYYYEHAGSLGVGISILLNILIAIIGFVPSIFLTTANLLFFGFWKGVLISFLGEALGAWIAFYLYRKGLKKFKDNSKARYDFINRLRNKQGMDAIILIVSLRLLPFVPSGIVTFVAAMGKVSMVGFVIASSLGKIPSMLLEAFSVYQITQLSWEGKIIIIVIALILFYLSLYRRKIHPNDTAE